MHPVQGCGAILLRVNLEYSICESPRYSGRERISRIAL